MSESTNTSYNTSSSVEDEIMLNYFEKNIHAALDANIVLWTIVWMLICVGIILNLFILKSMLKMKCNGTHYLILQIIIVDLISLAQVKLEVFYVSNGSWLDSIDWCPIYLGFDTFTGTSLIFFIVALNLHTISTFNLACKTIEKNSVDVGDDSQDEEFDESDSNSDSVVKQINDLRSIVIDYSQPKSQVPVLRPIICIWLLSASMSLPLFLYGRIIPSSSRNSNERMCGLMVYDSSSNFLLKCLLLQMRIVLPTFCLAGSTMYVISKLMTAKRNISRLSSIEHIIDENSEEILKLALSVSTTYMLCSLQRIYGSLWFELISRPLMEYKYAQFHKWIGVTGCCLHYSSIIVRPLLYRYFGRKLRLHLQCCISRRIS